MVYTGGSFKLEAPQTEGSVSNGTETVYPFTIENPTGGTVYIDGTEFSYTSHSDSDSNMYAYLTGTYHTVTVGGSEKSYIFDSANGTFNEADIAVTGSALAYGTDFTYENNKLILLTSAPMTLSGYSTTYTVFVPSGVAANVTLDGINIDVADTYNACAFEIENDTTADVTITLADESYNVLRSGGNCAGLRKTGDGNNADSLGELIIRGSGSLTAVGGSMAAGIGGSSDGIQGVGLNITIEGGTIIAEGGSSAAGIGGAYGSQGRNITIRGGNVTAIGNYGAGIGGGLNHLGVNIYLYGGNVTASSNYGYGIGSASGCSYDMTDGEIVISGGSVKISSDSYGSQIGGGRSAITPTNSTDPVYLLVIDNSSGGTVTVDGVTYPSKHSTDDTNVYVYLTGTTHTVTVSGVTKTYTFDPDTQTFTES